MKINTYNDWRKAVSNETKKLLDVDPWLSEEGKERLRVFDTLGDLSYFYQSANDLVQDIDSDAPNLTDTEKKAVRSHHAAAALKSLRNLVSKS